MKSAEQKLIEKIIDVLVSDATVLAKTEGRVYASHISTVQDPSFPAISIHIEEGTPRFECSELVDISFQIDGWFPRKTTDMSEVMEINQVIRGLLNRANLTDTTIGVKVMQIIEESSGPLMHESDTDLFHYPKRYRAVII